MNITPQLLKDIRLSDSFRGYNKDEVDELLERVGVAIGQLQGRLREAIDRADGAEARAATVGGRSESEDTLRRTLVLAQRTADAAIAEANAEAAQTLEEANAHAARTTSAANERASELVRAAEAQAAILRTETEAEVRRIAEESRAPLMEDIREAERVRNFLRDDIGLLERHLVAQRERLRVDVGELTRIIEEPSTLRLEPLPETSGIEASSLLAARDPLAVRVTASATLSESLPLAFVPAASDSADSADSADVTDDTDDEYPDDVAYASAEGLASRPTTDASSLPAAPDLTPSDPAWAHDNDKPSLAARADAGPSEYGGPVTRSVASIEDVPDRAGDQFLDQLRRAVDDEVGIDDGAMTDFFSDEVDEGRRSRFGRRR